LGLALQQELASQENPLSGIDGYYCSEAAWDAYKHIFGIDLDSETPIRGWVNSITGFYILSKERKRMIVCLRSLCRFTSKTRF